MVAMMVLSRMLSLNPQHSAVFIVDKVLLALQQVKVIRQELGSKKFKRSRVVNYQSFSSEDEL
jgi:hypothetical protein